MSRTTGGARGCGSRPAAGLLSLVMALVAAACTDTTQPRADEEPSAVGGELDGEDKAGGSGGDGDRDEWDGGTFSGSGGREAGGEGHVQPVVLVTHATRRPLRISQRTAERLIAGRVRSWSGLDGSDVALRVLRADGADPASVPGAAETPGRRFDPDLVVRAVSRRRNVVGVVPAEAVGPQVRPAVVAGVHPLRDPAGYPIKVPAGECPPDPVTVSIVGDIMLGRGVQEAAREAGDPAHALRPMQRRLAAADLTVGNLENTLSRAGAPTQGGDSFAADPAVVAGLTDAGFDVLSLANNHLGDFGEQALLQTVRRLRRGGLATFGAGKDLAAALQPAVVRRDGVSFAFLGFNAIGETPEAGRSRPGAASVSMPPRTGPLDRAELHRFLDVVRQADRADDVVVVMPHWGTQYTNVPEPIQSRVARRLVAAGADLVVGGHPHWVQGAEMVGDTLVVHSLGNFVFDMDFMPQTQRGLVLELTYWGRELKGAEFVPYRMDRDFAPRVVPWRRAQETLRLLWESSGPEFSR